MKDLYTPYVRPDGIIVGIKGEVPIPDQSERGQFYCYNYSPKYPCDKDVCQCHQYDEAIQSGHAFEDQEWAFRELAPFIDHDTLLPPIELDVTEIRQAVNLRNDGEWFDLKPHEKEDDDHEGYAYRTVLRIAKEEVKPLYKNDEDGWINVDSISVEQIEDEFNKVGLKMGEEKYVAMAEEILKPTEELTETQEGAALSWLQYIEGFPKIKELWESLSKSQPVMAKLFEININNFVDSQRKPK